MNVFTFIFLVTLVGCAIPLSKIWLDHRRSLRMGEGVPNDVRREIAALESRVQVLEEIVTDQKYSLMRELDALESQPTPLANQVKANGGYAGRASDRVDP